MTEDRSLFVWDGQRHEHTGTTWGAGWVTDIWRNLDASQGAPQFRRAGAVVTVAPWATVAVEPFLSWADNWGYAVAHPPAPTPAGRFTEAIDQAGERVRHRQRGG